MPLFNVVVERSYTARHVATVLVEAADDDAARELVEAAIESDDLDPSELPYSDTHQSEGYDDAGLWELVDDDRGGEIDPEAPWAGDNGRCRVCQGGHYNTPACAGAATPTLKAGADGP